MEFGETLKKIRKNKGYTQVYTTRNIISQSSFSKFEKGHSDINCIAFFELLERLEISSNEFFYLHNNYQYSEKNLITQHFFSLPYNNHNLIKNLKKRVNDYLKQNENDSESSLLNDILLICEALILLSNESDVVKARSIVLPIWDRIVERDNWLVIEIKIINSILYFFDLDVAIEITNTLLKKINRYNEFEELGNMKCLIQVNLSLLFIKSNKYNDALNIIEHLLNNNIKKLSYYTLAVCLGRREICKQKLNMSTESSDLEKAIALVNIYNDNILKEYIINEVNYYTN